MYEIESIIIFKEIKSLLLIAGLHLMHELYIYLKKGNETNDSNI